MPRLPSSSTTTKKRIGASTKAKTHNYVYGLYIIIPVLTYIIALVTQSSESYERMSLTYDPYFLMVLWMIAHSFLSYIFVSKLHTHIKSGDRMSKGLLFVLCMLAVLYGLMVSWHVVLQTSEQKALYIAVAMLAVAAFAWPILSFRNVGHGAVFGVVVALLLVAFTLNQSMNSIETTSSETE